MQFVTEDDETVRGEVPGLIKLSAGRVYGPRNLTGGEGSGNLHAIPKGDALKTRVGKFCRHVESGSGHY
jgi:hypothetical protein